MGRHLSPALALRDGQWSREHRGDQAQPQYRKTPAFLRFTRPFPQHRPFAPLFLLIPKNQRRSPPLQTGNATQVGRRVKSAEPFRSIPCTFWGFAVRLSWNRHCYTDRATGCLLVLFCYENGTDAIAPINVDLRTSG